MNIRSRFCALLVSSFTAGALLLATPAQAGQALAVSAQAADQAVSQGAFVLDLRSAAAFASGRLPHAVNLPSDAASLPLTVLAQLLSAAGADSSRTLLIVGEAGDLNAYALWQRLGAVASGRVLWFVGGVQEWQLTGRTLTVESSTHQPVPQFLTPFQPEPTRTRMAGSRVRSSDLLERDLTVKIAGL
ncbi:MAG: rhodanese-like domain-containing protein [Brachymonas sp.]|nr:rhodanese-like domain-containing protein [Brachymonas sp.]